MARRPKLWDEFGGQPQPSFYQPPTVPFDVNNPQSVEDLDRYHGGGSGGSLPDTENSSSDAPSGKLYTLIIPGFLILYPEQVKAFIARFPKEGRSFASLATIMLRKKGFYNSKILTYELKNTDPDNLFLNKVSRKYDLEVLDEDGDTVFPVVGSIAFKVLQARRGAKLRYKERPLLKTTDEKLARLATEFVEAFNASSDKGKENYFRQVMQRTSHGHLLPLEPSTTVLAGSSNSSTTELAKQPVQGHDCADDDISPRAKQAIGVLPASPTEPSDGERQSPTAKKSFNRQSFTPKELWQRRDKGSTETPDVFIGRVYKDVIGTIDRQDLKHYDEPLYNRLNKWLQQPQSAARNAPKNRLPAGFGPLSKSHDSPENIDDLVGRWRAGGVDGMSAHDYMRAQAAARRPRRAVG